MRTASYNHMVMPISGYSTELNTFQMKGASSHLIMFYIYLDYDEE